MHLSAPLSRAGGRQGYTGAYASAITKLYGGDFGDCTLVLEVKPQWFQCVLIPFAFAAWCVGDFDCLSNVRFIVFTQVGERHQLLTQS